VKQPNNSFTISLMLSSIVLLLILQAMWIRNSYVKASDDFRKEANLLFRNTILAMRDSLIQFQPDNGGDFDSVRLKFEGHPSDTLINRVFLPHHDRRGPHGGAPREADSVRIQRGVIEQVVNPRGKYNIFFREGPDTLSLDSVRANYRNALAEAGIDLPFRVSRLKRGEHFDAQKEQGITESVRISPFMRYAISFDGVRNRLIRQIIPQILFSIFLTGLTMASFFVMYRSLRAQLRLAEIKNDFISNVTHELKTPISTVSVALEALRDFKGLNNPDLTREYLDIAQHELNRLSLLTDNVLRTAIFERNGIAFTSERVDLNSITDMVVNSMKLVFEKAKAVVSINKKGNAFTVSGSKDHLTNVVFNLLDNALKYSPGQADIHILLEEMPECIRLSIRDRGIGIPEEYQKKIFEKFFRVPTGDIHTIKGYGLGLNYVADVIKSHHGSIDVESKPGEGSCFIITLPKG
jgi:two-component system, OmpR family, phosphate regulon sensor histidine kinase PhoR